jgi:prepilin-type N-terminal cleavage/methylation domain-containing protein
MIPMKANCIPKNATRGFTLIELLLGLAIIGILAGIALPAYNNYIDRSRAAAFLVQLDAWREKAAVETVASGADLCNWDEARFGKLRERIFGTTNTNPISFSDYQLEVTGRDPVGPGGPANRPFVVDVVATASDGSRALNVARMIRQELERAGLRYVSPATDRDLVSMQSFSALLGNCRGQAGTPTGPGTVGGLVSVVNPNGPAQQVTPKPSLPQPPKCGPGQQLKADNSGCEPKTCPQGQVLDASGNCAALAPQCSPLQQLSSDGKRCEAKTCPSGQQLDANGSCFVPPSCAASEVLSADGKSCVPKTCPAGQQLDASGSCFTPAKCSPLQVPSPDLRSCVAKQCPGGTHLDANGSCVANAPSSHCPAGQRTNPQGHCVPAHGH